MTENEQIRRELLEAVREILRYAILTLHAVRDPDRRYLGWANLPQTVVHDVGDAYGYSTPWVRRFSPTAQDISQMERVLPWLAWLRREEGQPAIRRIIAWSMGVSTWRIGQREQCSDATIMNRINRSTAAIIRQFADVDLVVEYLDEPYKGAVYAIIWEKPNATQAAGLVRPSRVYVGGRGMYRGGRPVRDHKIEGLKGVD